MHASERVRHHATLASVKRQISEPPLPPPPPGAKPWGVGLFTFHCINTSHLAYVRIDCTRGVDPRGGSCRRTCSVAGWKQHRYDELKCVGSLHSPLSISSTLISLSCRRRRSFNRRTSHLNTARRRSISPQSSARTPQRPAAMDAAPHGPYGRRADARPASVGRLSGLSGRCRPRCCRSGPLHAPHKQRQL